MKHIGIDARVWRKEVSGLSRYTQNLVIELLKVDQENRYTVILTPADDREFDLVAPNLDKIVVDIPHYSYAEQYKLPGILLANKFDLMHFTHFNHPLLYRRPFVITVHDLIMHLFPSGAQTKSPLRKMAYRMVMNHTKAARRIIVPSEATKRDLVRMLNFPAQKIVVTPEASAEKFRERTEDEKRAIRKKLGLPDRYILFVSRWEKYKGLEALLEAYDQVYAKHPDVGLVICGKPAKQNPEIAELVFAKQKKNSLIVTPGFVDDDDLPIIFSASSVWVHPSWYEGFGLMVLEAMGAGAPVVTSDTSSLPEVVGDAGILINPHQPNEIAEAILRLLENPQLAEEYRRKGYGRAKQYSWKRMAEQTLAVYQKALNS